ncbi:tetratricopeptide repeat protein (plasmid) [Streptomyces sp. NBC_00868]|uniref:ATP-binding protein n=1 Tax=Streptomyces sp. NBC_00868 TaxID=2903683 RepID=UPI0038702272|nr:tetratricopeptide repeat protein [Streptomyces sp. NBC_00868]
MISAIAGTGGIGKTSLALQWAHRTRHRFPDGQLWVNLHGYDAGSPPSTDQVLDSFLTELGVAADRIPHTTDAKAALYRSLLAGHRILIVLDNAATPEQIRALLPGEPGCLVMVTSRSRLSGLVARDGAHRISLDILTPAESHTLLAGIIGPARTHREPEAAAQLAHHCAHLPLALRIAAERIAARPHLTIADFVHDLTTEHQRLNELATDDETTAVRGVFSWSYHALPEEAARAFRLLGPHPGPSISLDAAAALTGTTRAATRRLLDTLVGVHLLTETTAERYQFHDLLRDYAAECAAADEPADSLDASTSRLYTWYLHTAHAALYAYYPHHPEVPLDPRPATCHPLAFTDRDHARTWFAAEHTTLVTLVRQAPAAGQHTVGWQLPNALDCYLDSVRHTVDQVAVHRMGLAAAQHLDHHLGQQWAYGHLGCALQNAHRDEEAIVYFQRGAEIARQIGHAFGEAACLGDLSRSYNVLGRYAEAAEHSRRALDIYRFIGHQRNQAVSLSNLGNALSGLGLRDQGLVHMQEAIDTASKIGDVVLESLSLQRLAAILHQLGRTDDAVTTLQKAAELIRPFGVDYSYAEVLRDLGDLQAAAGALGQATRAWQEALAIFTGIEPDEAAAIRQRLNTINRIEPDEQSAAPTSGDQPARVTGRRRR